MSWLDSHAGSMQFLASVVLVIVTVVYVVYTKRLVNKTYEQFRPYVFVEVVKRGAMLDAVIRNTGQRGAVDVSINITADVVIEGYDKRGILGWPMFQKAIPYLPPGQSIRQDVAHFPSIQTKLMHMEPDKRILEYTIKYKDGKELYETSFKYDLSFLCPTGGDPFPLAGDDIGQINESLKNIDKTLKGLRLERGDRS